MTLSNYAPPITAISTVFDNQHQAKEALGDLEEMHGSGAIEILDAAVLAKDSEGTITIEDRGEFTAGKGARRGAVIGTVLGILFPPGLVATAAIAGAGAAAGALFGKKTDRGFFNPDLEVIAADLDRGSSALLAVVEETWVATLDDALEGYDRMFQHVLDSEEFEIVMDE